MSQPTPITGAIRASDHGAEPWSREDILTSHESLERQLGEAIEQQALIRRHLALRVEDDSIVASCSCLTKTNDPAHHKKGCKYRLISERDALRHAVLQLRTEVNCRIEHGAESHGNLEFVQQGLDKILKLQKP